MNQSPKICYIDDDADLDLSSYLAKNYGSDFFYLQHDSSDDYERLFAKIISAKPNIIIIDSKLFNDKTTNCSKVYGEEFIPILLMDLPFIQTILITQNTGVEIYGSISKFKSSRDSHTHQNAEDFYNKNLKEAIQKAITKYQHLIAMSEKVSLASKNGHICENIADRINRSICGIVEYNNLSDEKVDELIVSFQNLLVSLKESKDND